MFTIQSNSIQTIKENIMTYFNGTLQEFTYLHEQVTEISNPDESYLGTLNSFFKEPVTLLTITEIPSRYISTITLFSLSLL